MELESSLLPTMTKVLDFETKNLTIRSSCSSLAMCVVMSKDISWVEQLLALETNFS